MNEVCLGYVRPRMVEGAFCDALADLIAYDGRHGRQIGQVTRVYSGPRIAPARNNVIREFLAGSCDRLLMLDTDLTFGEDLVERITARAELVESKVHAGLVVIGRGDQRWVNFAHAGRDEHGHITFHTPPGLPETAQMVQADAAGAGCLLIEREVLVEIEHRWVAHTVYPWFEESQQKPCAECGFPGSELGEDVTFCLRATAAGFPITVDLDLELGHERGTTLTRDSISVPEPA